MSNRYINKASYFTKAEANTAKTFLIRFIGREMLYAFQKEPARVVDIEILATGIEIANYGEIEEGFLKNDVMFRILTDHQKSLSAHLTKALKYERIVGTKQKGQNGYVFSLP